MNKYQKVVLVAVAVALVIVYFITPLMCEYLGNLFGAYYSNQSQAFRLLSYMISKIIIVLIMGAIFFFFFMGIKNGEKKKDKIKPPNKLMKKKRKEDVGDNP